MLKYLQRFFGLHIVRYALVGGIGIPINLATLAVFLYVFLRHGSNELDSSSPTERSSPVTLSAAKGLARQAERCFAPLSKTAKTPIKSAHEGSLISKCLQKPKEH